MIGHTRRPRRVTGGQLNRRLIASAEPDRRRLAKLGDCAFVEIRAARCVAVRRRVAEVVLRCRVRRTLLRILRYARRLQVAQRPQQ